MQLNRITHDFLVLIRRFDERAGWLKWSCESCAEWLHYHCDISKSAARVEERCRELRCGTAASTADALKAQARREMWVARDPIDADDGTVNEYLLPRRWVALPRKRRSVSLAGSGTRSPDQFSPPPVN